MYVIITYNTCMHIVTYVYTYICYIYITNPESQGKRKENQERGRQIIILLWKSVIINVEILLMKSNGIMMKITVRNVIGRIQS